MKPMLGLFGLLAVFVVATFVAVFAADYGDGVVRTAGYVATLAFGGVIALLIQCWKNRRPGARRPR
jgi:hypothetical protein